MDVNKKVVAAKWPPVGTAKNFPMAFDETCRRLFIGCRQPAKLLVLDTDTGVTIASVEIVGNTDDVFFDRALNRIYVSGSKGSATVVQRSGSDHSETLAPVPVGEPSAYSARFPISETLRFRFPGGHRADAALA